MQGVSGGESGVDVAEDGGESNHLHLRRPQCHEYRHRIICHSYHHIHTYPNPNPNHRERERLIASIQMKSRIMIIQYNIENDIHTNTRIGVDDDLLLLLVVVVSINGRHSQRSTLNY